MIETVDAASVAVEIIRDDHRWLRQ